MGDWFGRGTWRVATEKDNHNQMISPARCLPLILLLALSAVALFVVLRSPPAHTIDLGAPGDTHFAARFSIPETSEGGTFRWSVKNSLLRLHGADIGALLLSMRLYGDDRAHAGDWHMRLEREKHALVTLDMRPGWRIYRVLLPEGAATDGMEAAQLDIVSDPYTYSPRDHRDLGSPVDWVRVAPLDALIPPALPPLRRALMLTWVLAVLAGLLWFADTTLLPRHASAAPLRVSLVTAGVAVALVVWAQRDPAGLAYTLPATPWLLGMATFLLLVCGVRERIVYRLSSTQERWLQFAGLLCLLVAQGLFATRWSDGVGIALMVVGVLLLTIPRPHHPQPAPPPQPAHPWYILLLLFLVALGLRLYQIDALPYGLWRDEARHGLIALSILDDPTYRPIYVASGGVNMPALGFYPFALALRVFGIHTWTMRLVTACGGALTVLPLYALVLRLSGRRNVALLAAALLAVSSWHITISRFSFPSVFEPLLALTALWLILRSVGGDEPELRVTRSSLLLLLLAGACLGVSVQNYHTGRVVPIVAGLLALLLLLPRLQQWRSWLLLMLALAVGFALTLAPLVTYALRHPSAFNNRVNDVFLLSETALRGRAPLAALDDSVGRHVMMFSMEGDSNGRHHDPRQPMLDLVTGMGFLVGCAVLLRHWRGWRSLFLAGALAAGLLPSMLAVAGPHAMRSIGSVAFACTIAAIGWAEMLQGVPTTDQECPSAESRLLRARASLLIPVLLVAARLNAWSYFVAMPVNPSVWLSFYPVHTQIGSYVRELANEQGPQAVEHVYVPSGLMDNAVLVYLAHGLPLQTFDGATVSAAPPPGARFVLSGYSAPHDAALLAPYLGDHPTPVLLGPALPGTSDPSFVVYQVNP